MVQRTGQTLTERLWHIAIWHEHVGMHITQLPDALVEEQLTHRTYLPAGLKHIVEVIQFAPYKHHRAAIHKDKCRIPQFLNLQGEGYGLDKTDAKTHLEDDEEG